MYRRIRQVDMLSRAIQQTDDPKDSTTYNTKPDNPSMRKLLIHHETKPQ